MLAKSPHPTVNHWVGEQQVSLSTIRNTFSECWLILVPAAASFLRHIPHPHSSYLMTVIQPPGVQWVEHWLQLKLGYSCELLTPRVQSQETNVFFLCISCRWPFWVIKHIWYDYWPRKISPWRIRHNHEFNDHTVTWDTDTIPWKTYNTLSSIEILIEVYMSANEPQTLTNEYYWATRILDTEYEQVYASIDDVIKTSENLHVEEQHQLT
jgi:hypothetical protein